jgi:preprotein translocase subunit SecG
MSILLGILTFVLILVSLFLVLVVLAQKAKNDGGMGAAMGGGMAEAAFGADTSNVLSKATINAAIAFFILAFALYLGRLYQRTHVAQTGDALPTIAAPAAVKPAAPAATTPAATTPTAKTPAPEAAKKP